MERKKFKSEVSELLQLIIHSLYSHKEIFLRELVSNASDAIDKLKYKTLTDSDLKKLNFEPRIDISFDEKEKILVISDNGIGMAHDDIANDLGVIARSGTKNFLKELTEDQKKDSNLIGQFGVGFYSVFMVADKVEVITKKAGLNEAYKWTSTGKSSYTIEESNRDTQGTTIIIHLNDEGIEYASRWQIENLIKKYSDHIACPIFLAYDSEEYTEEKDADGNPIKKVEHKVEQVNSASALWARSKSSLTSEDYNEFYKSSTYDNENPLWYLHTHVEGVQEYTTLFYVPAKAPFDMYKADYKPGVKLYVKRVCITDDEKELLPTYLRFVRGVIDSEDLPLNVSREILQQNKIMNSIRNSSVKKLLGEWKKLSQDNPELYKEFIEQYNRPLKEGLYQDFANRDDLLELVRFESSSEDGFVSFSDYVERMKDEQKEIYYIAGSKALQLRKSPLLEGYKTKGLEVLIMEDEIDDLVIGSLGTYKEYKLVAINKSNAIEESEEKKEENKDKVNKIKTALGDKVKDVISSTRLTTTPCVVVTDSNDPTVQMAEMLKAMGNDMMGLEAKPILEVNFDHPLIMKLESSSDEKYVKALSEVLLEQALLREGVMPKDLDAFSNKLIELLT